MLPFIRRAKIKHIIERQCKRERQYTEKRLKDENEHTIKTMEQSHMLDMQEKDAEISTLQEHIIQLQKIVQDAETIYLKAVNMQKQARRVSSDIMFQAEQALTLSMKFHQAMLEMSTTAEKHEMDALSDFQTNKKLLRGGNSH